MKGYSGGVTRRGALTRQPWRWGGSKIVRRARDAPRIEAVAFQTQVDIANAKFLGANPTKDSKWGRKSRAGVAVTFINPARTGGWEPSCTVIESIGYYSVWPTCALSQQPKRPQRIPELS